MLCYSHRMLHTSPKPPRIYALLMASGRGERMGTELPKAYLPLNGKPMLGFALDCFLTHPAISGVAAVIHPEHLTFYQTITGHEKLLPPIMGSADSRQMSVLLGLRALAPFCPDYVLIHDAARPELQAEDLTAVLDGLASDRGVVLGKMAVDSLHRLDTDKTLASPLPRAEIFIASTPQAFPFTTILRAHEQALVENKNYTDDAAIARAVGMTIQTLCSPQAPIKITTNPDYQQLCQRLQKTYAPRSGMGYDIHRLVAGTEVVLGGIAIPCPYRLDGHSDADVVLHALTDALLGSCGGGDIGALFPPSDPQWRGADSCIFVAKAMQIVRNKGGILQNADMTILAEVPKIHPHRTQMQNRIAAILGIDSTRVNIKATTLEGLGALGQSQGIAAHAIVTVLYPDA